MIKNIITKLLSKLLTKLTGGCGCHTAEKPVYSKVCGGDCRQGRTACNCGPEERVTFANNSNYDYNGLDGTNH